MAFGTEPWSVLELGKACGACGWLTPTKQVVCKVLIAEAVTPWQLMIRAPAQAGNRASKTGCHLQRRDPEAECQAVPSGKCKAHYSALFGEVDRCSQAKAPSTASMRAGCMAGTQKLTAP